MFLFSSGTRGDMSIVPESYDASDDTVMVEWLTDPVAIEQTRTGQLYRCELSTNPEDVDLSDANRGQPVVHGHFGLDITDVIGRTVPNTTTLVAGRGRSRVKLSDLDVDRPITDKIRRGYADRVSLKWEAIEAPEIVRPTQAGEMMTVRVKRWRLAHIAFVAFGADGGAGTRGRPETEETTMDLKARNKDIRAEGARLKLSQSVIDELCDDAVLTLEQARSKMQEAWAAAQASTSSSPDLKARNTEFRTLGARAKVPQAVIDELCDDAEITLEAGRAKLVEAWAGEQQAEPEVDTRHGGRVYVQEDERDKMRGAMVHGLGMRSAPDLFPREKAPAGAEDFRGARLPGILKMLGQRNGMRNLDRMSEAQMVDECLGLSGDGYRAAVQMTAGDFSAITSALANVSIARSYSGEQPSYRSFCGRRMAPDFNAMTEIDFGTSDVAEQLGEGGEIKFGKIVEGSRSWVVISFAKRYGLSRKLILNSRVDLLTQLPQKMVKLIVTLEQNQAWGVLLSGANLADGKPIFDATRNNISSVTKGVPSVATLDAAFQLMGDQVDLDGTPMNLEPVNLLIPHAYRANAATVLGGLVPNKPANATPDYMRSLGLIPEKRLAGVTPPWFAACDPEQHASIVYAMLDGYEAPRVSSRVGWDVQGVEIKIEHDFGCTGLDGKGLVKILAV